MTEETATKPWGNRLPCAACAEMDGWGCRECHLAAEDRSKPPPGYEVGLDPSFDAEWCPWPIRDFHEATLRNCGLPGAGADALAVEDTSI